MSIKDLTCHFHPASVPGGSAGPKAHSGTRISFAGPPDEGSAGLRATRLTSC